MHTDHPCIDCVDSSVGGLGMASGHTTSDQEEDNAAAVSDDQSDEHH